MRKIAVIYSACIVLLFFLPILLVKEKFIQSVEKIENVSEIKVLITETNEVRTMSLDEYIMGVLIGEMPVAYELEALKAQAVVARTYTLNKLKNAKRFA